MVVEFHPDGLHAQCRYSYMLGKNGDRLPVDDMINENSHGSGPVFHFHAGLYLPPFLNPMVWKRHNLTRADIMVLLDQHELCSVWQTCLVLMCGKPLCVEQLGFSIKSTYQNLFTFVFCYKKALWEAFCNEYAGNQKSSDSLGAQGGKLCYVRTDHTPYLPLQFTDNKVQYDAYQSAAPMGLSVFRSTPYHGPLLIKDGIPFIPVEYDQDMILFSRISPVDTNPLCKPKDCVIHMSPRVSIGVQMYEIREESFWLCMESKRESLEKVLVTKTKKHKKDDS